MHCYILKQLCLIKLERKTHIAIYGYWEFLGERVGAAYRERANCTLILAATYT